MSLSPVFVKKKKAMRKHQNSECYSRTKLYIVNCLLIFNTINICSLISKVKRIQHPILEVKYNSLGLRTSFLLLLDLSICLSFSSGSRMFE